MDTSEHLGHQQPSEIEQVAALISPASPDEVHLVMPAATPPSDETRFLGNPINVPLRMGKPLAYLSDGTSVPGSVAPAGTPWVAEALLP